MTLLDISRSLSDAVDELSFGDPVTHVYNPLAYARVPHERYLRRFGPGKGRIVLVGMNPGPFGMVQTGVPFGDVGFVRDWMGLGGAVVKPTVEHPKRPVLGFSCERSEVSGSRLWGWASERFGSAQAFFDRFFVLNYCPLAFLEESGRNRTPDKLPAEERRPLFRVCDRALADSLSVLSPRCVLGIGSFAHRRVQDVTRDLEVEVGMVLHPSPASPRANRGWSREVERDFERLGISLPG